MKIIIGYSDCDNNWDEDELYIEPLEWPYYCLHTRYSNYIEIRITDFDWSKYHLWVPLSVFNEIHPNTNFILMGEDARSFYRHYLRQCRFLFDDIIEKSSNLLLKHGWNDIKIVKPETGRMCELAIKDIGIDDTSWTYRGFDVKIGKYVTGRNYAPGCGGFEVEHNCFYLADYWKYIQDDY